MKNEVTGFWWALEFLDWDQILQLWAEKQKEKYLIFKHFVNQSNLNSIQLLNKLNEVILWLNT